MVQIHIKLASDNGDESSAPKSGAARLEEWSIIELQGDLEVENGESLTNKFMGDLHFNKDGTPIMILGHHIMMGKVMNLDKPMVLMRKHVRPSTNKSSGAHADDNNDGDDETSRDSSSTLTEYLVHAVIRKKILFNKRPRPIVFSTFKK